MQADGAALAVLALCAPSVVQADGAALAVLASCAPSVVLAHRRNLALCTLLQQHWQLSAYKPHLGPISATSKNDLLRVELHLREV